MSDKFPADVLPSMNVPILISVIEYFNLEYLIKMLSTLDTDDITYVLEVCDEELRKQILLGMPNDLKKLIKKSLKYSRGLSRKNNANRLCFSSIKLDNRSSY